MRSFTLAAIAAGMVLAATAAPAQAQRWRGGYRGGYGYNYGHRGWYGGYGYSSYYPRYGYGYRYSPYYYSYYYPSYGYSYGYNYPGYTFNYPSTTYYYPSTTYVETPSSFAYSYPAPQTSTSFYRGPVEADKVLLRVLLPVPDARLTIQDQAVQSTGRERTFISPAMDRNVNYTYTLRATWNDGTKEMTREKTIDVQTGREFVIDFNTDTAPIAAPVTRP